MKNRSRFHPPTHGGTPTTRRTSSTCLPQTVGRNERSPTSMPIVSLPSRGHDPCAGDKAASSARDQRKSGASPQLPSPPTALPSVVAPASFRNCTGLNASAKIMCATTINRLASPGFSERGHDRIFGYRSSLRTLPVPNRARGGRKPTASV